MLQNRVRSCAVTLAVFGCSLATEPPSAAPSIEGTITAIQHSANGDPPFPHIFVEENPGQLDVGDKAFIGFTSAEIIVQRPAGSWRRGTVQDLVVGVKVRAWVGEMLNTYPEMGDARDIAVYQ